VLQATILIESDLESQISQRALISACGCAELIAEGVQAQNAQTIHSQEVRIQVASAT
jgi:hypothetical protein